ncbi:MAG: hypothetical protein HKN31_11270, partial [Pricia sp.]|nr:hypothetical protein [Pricia sp.]
MARLFVFGVFLLVCLSCKDQKAEVVANENFINEMSSEKWPKKAAVNAKAASILEEWEEYKALETSFDALYLVDNREDLSLTIENLIEAQKNLEGSEYPPELDIAQVKSRQKVFKTYILKVKGDLIYRIDPH